MLFLSMGLFACVAFSPQPAFAEPDTGPSISEDNKAVFSISASADLIMPDQWVFEISNTYNYSAFEQASGQETVLHRSDHTVGNVNVFFNYRSNDLVTSKMIVNSTGLAEVVEPKRRTCASNVMKDTYNDLDLSKKTAAGLPIVGSAQRSRQMVWVLRPAWTKVSYLRC